MCFWGLVYLLTLATLSSTVTAAESVQCELRFVWGSTQSQRISGKISVDQGILRTVRNLSMQPDSIGSIQVISPREIGFSEVTASTFGGFDFEINAALSSLVTVQCTEADSGHIVEHRTTVGRLMEGNWIENLRSGGGRIAIERQLSDRLRISSDRDHFVFRPGEAWEFSVAGYRTGLPDGEYDLYVEFENEPDDKLHRRVQLENGGSFTAESVTIVVPTEPGGQLLRVSLYRSGILTTLVPQAPALLRRLDVCVFDDVSPPTDLVAWSPLAEIDALQASRPGALAWLAPAEVRRYLPVATAVDVAARIKPYNPLAGTFSTPEHIGQLSSRSLPDIGYDTSRCLSIATNSWLAIPLDGLQVGVPHRLRVRYPTDQPMRLAISVQSLDSPDSASVDTAINLRQVDCTLDGTVQSHDIVFWPTGEKQRAVLANMDSRNDSSVIAVTVEVAQQAPVKPGRQDVGRRVGVYFDQPMLADAFAVGRTADPVLDRKHESWETWAEAAKRLSQTMSWQQADVVFLNIYEDGGSLFPSSLLDPTHRFEKGTFYSDSRSPDIKDCVELLMRSANRDDRQVVLVLNFDAPIPALVELQKRNAENDGILQVSVDSQSKRRQYNPLDTRVQTALSDCVGELLERYGHHRSFAGICFRLDNDSHQIFAGDRWNYDAKTLADFEQAIDSRIGKEQAIVDVFAQDTVRRMFLQWRAKALADFYEALGTKISQVQPGAKLYLQPARLISREANREDFYRPELVSVSIHNRLLAHGLDATAISSLPNVELTTTTMRSADSALQPVGGISHGNQDATTIVQQTAMPFRLPASDQAVTGKWIYPSSVSPAHLAVRDIVRELHKRDSLQLLTGGWAPRQGHSEHLRALHSAFAALPPVLLTDFLSQSIESNIRVRSGQFQGRSYIQLINNAPWIEQVSIELKCGKTTSAAKLVDDGTDWDWTLNGDGTSKLKLQLLPYSLTGFVFSDDLVTIREVTHACLPSELQRIEAELNSFEQIVTRSGDPTLLTSLGPIAGTFEQWTASGQPVAWNVSSLPQVRIGAAREFPRTGNTSLLIENRSHGETAAWVESRPVPPPATGRAMVSAWLRSSAGDDPMRVRVSIVGRLKSGDRYERSLETGGRSINSTPIPVDWGRVPIQLHVSDIPIDEVVSLHVSIELIGLGRLWVDDVEIYEMLLQPDERRELRGRLLVARERISQGEPYFAYELLSSSWGEYLGEHAHLAQQGMMTKADRDTSFDGNSANNWNSTTPILQRWREAVKKTWTR